MTREEITSRICEPHEGESCEFWERMESDPDVDPWDREGRRG